MKIIQSFWSKPFTRSDSLLIDARFNGGWPHRIMNYYSWALSCLQLCKFYDSVELVTDKLGKEILIDKLKLPYTRVTVALNDIDVYNEAFWALGKLYAYGLQKEPFLHVDGDIFIWKEFGDEIMNAALISQNLETKIPASQGVHKAIWQKFTYLPDYFKGLYDQEYGNCSNAGILGGNDFLFFENYVKEAFAFLDKNMQGIDSSMVDLNSGHLNVIFEQVIFYAYAKYCRKEVTYLFPEAELIPPEIGYFHAAARNRHFVHCFGFYKNIRIAYSFLEWKLKEFYPIYYKRITDMVAASEI